MVEVRPVTIKVLALLPGSPASLGATAQLEGPAAQAVQALTSVPPRGHSIMENRL